MAPPVERSATPPPKKKSDEAIFRTLVITWPQGVLGEEDNITAAAQVHGGVG
jgi:hypothetical protein